MLRITDLLSLEDVGLDVRAMSKKHVLLELARMLAAQSGLPDTVFSRRSPNVKTWALPDSAKG
ncbi:hypothetical protein [Mesorhizobium sp. WSM2239]|uniref:Uncharacterized protein n=2 Tax=unclassified Mesorhizobium TaxID=325217 RepID=A0AAU8DH22_9HYPH